MLFSTPIWVFTASWNNYTCCLQSKNYICKPARWSCCMSVFVHRAKKSANAGSTFSLLMFCKFHTHALGISWMPEAATSKYVYVLIRFRYDEPALLKEVEKRLGHPIQRLGLDLKLPGSNPSKAGSVVYGKEKGGGHSKVSSFHHNCEDWRALHTHSNFIRWQSLLVSDVRISSFLCTVKSSASSFSCG